MTITPPTTSHHAHEQWGGVSDASVSTQWMTSFNQLNIAVGSQNDSILVTQSGSTIYVNVNGVTNSYTGSYGDIVVAGRFGRRQHHGGWFA